MFSALFDFFKNVLSSIADPVYSFSIDGVSLYRWAFFVFLAFCFVRFVLPLCGLNASADMPSGAGASYVESRRPKPLVKDRRQ